MIAPTSAEDAVVLRATDGTEAYVLPSSGANCAICRTPVAGGWAHLLAPVPSLEAVRERPTSVGGFPILFPHPGRHRLPLRWQGREIRPPGATGDGLGGHGYAAGATWTPIGQTATSIRCRLDSRDVPPESNRWPWPARLTATYRLSPRSLSFELTIENLSDEPAPVMPGLHPYFPLRFLESDTATPEEARQTCAVWIDAEEIWALDRGGATGDVTPVSGTLDLRAPNPRTIAEIEAAFQGRMPVQLYGRRDALEGAARGTAKDAPDAPGGVTSGIWDRASNLAITFETSRAFGTVALYRPPDPTRVSLEPRAALPDALHVVATRPDVPTGLRILAPGALYRAWARITLNPREETP